MRSIDAAGLLVHHGFLEGYWHLRVRFVVLPYQVLLTITITTALSFDTARRNEVRVLFYPLLVREDLKQR
ncbi:hypothetical protein AB3S75_025758 [Citrus x aurantiifolia]